MQIATKPFVLDGGVNFLLTINTYLFVMYIVFLSSMFGFLLTSFVFTAAPPLRGNDPFGSAQTTRQNSPPCHLRKVFERLGANIQEGQPGTFLIGLEYRQGSGCLARERLDLTSIVQDLTDVRRTHFFEQIKSDVADVLTALDKYLTEYQRPKRKICHRSSTLKTFERIIGWGGASASTILAGISGKKDGSGFAPAFYAGIGTTIVAQSLTLLSDLLKTRLDLAFKKRGEVDEVLSTILLRYSAPEHELISLVFIRMICGILNYGSSQKYLDKLSLTWAAGLKSNFPNFTPEHTAVVVDS